MYITVLIAALFYGRAAAQDGSISGSVVNHDILNPSSAVSLMQQNTFGSARVMGMGGAFTALGADLSSTSINPAGIGMYKRNDIGFSLGINVASQSNSASNLEPYRNSVNTKTKFGLNNIGAAFKVYEGKNKLTAVNLAIAYNKIADYNYGSSFKLRNGKSLAKAWADVANANGMKINSENHITDKNNYADYDMNPCYWGNVLAYKCGLINRIGGVWINDEINPVANTDNYHEIKSSGSAGEFSLGAGFNFSNFVYFGLTLDIATINRTQYLYYGEMYNNSGIPQQEYQLDYFNYDQTTITKGTGIGAKFGITFRPFEKLRIGIAYHTPKRYSFTYQYQAQMSSMGRASGEIITADELSPKKIDTGNYKWVVSSSSKVLLGVSYILGKSSVIDVDYEFYNPGKVTYSKIPGDSGYNNVSELNSIVNGQYKSTHTIRAGFETFAVNPFYLRAGGGYTTSAIRINTYELNHLMNGSWYASAGIGVRLGIARVDLAYSYRKYGENEYLMFHTSKTVSDNIQSRYSCHNVSLGIGVSF